jgi:TetR/AcrR family transcriptional regulator, regulator of autoinduction and epiphytic fitness
MVSTTAHPDPRVVRSQARVLDAVAYLLVEEGVAGVTIDAVMTRSGVARATVYRHWPSRRALVLAGLHHLLPPPTSTVRTGGPLYERLRAQLTGLTRQMSEEPWARALPALLDAARRVPEVERATARFVEERRAPLRALLDEAVQNGELPPLEVQVALAQLLGPLVYRKLITSEPLDETLCASVVAGFLHGHLP